MAGQEGSQRGDLVAKPVSLMTDGDGKDDMAGLMVIGVDVRDEMITSKMECVGYLSCRRQDGTSVMLQVHGFMPWLYVRLPRGMRKTQIQEYQEKIYTESRVPKSRIQLGRKDNLVGWQPDRPDSSEAYRPIYAKVHALSSRELRRVADYLRQEKMEVFEDRISPAHKLCCQQGIQRSGWIDSSPFMPATASLGSSAGEELKCHVRQLRKLERQSVAPLVMASFDLECYSESGGFPRPANFTDMVVQIGVSVQRFGEDQPCQRTVLCLKETAPVAGCEIRCFATELELLNGFVDMMVDELDVDILLGYNIFQFDFSYMAERMIRLEAFLQEPNNLLQLEARQIQDAQRVDDGGTEEMWDRSLSLEERWGRALTLTPDRRGWFGYARQQGRTPREGQEGQLWRMNRLRTDRTLLTEKPMSNAASGSNLLKLFQLRGRVVFDLYQYIKTNHKLSSYKLDNVAQHFIGDKKVDLKPAEMFALFTQGPEQRAKIAAYCIQDCDLPLRIIQHLKIIPALVELSRVTCTDLSDIITRGQQIKVFNLFTTYCHGKNIVVNDTQLEEFQSCPYMGALVLDPKVAFYNCPIACLDFASLYPSIMMSENLCYSTLILPSQLKGVQQALGDRRDAVLTPYKVEGETFWIVKPEVKRGVLPDILQSILAQRKIAKKAMAQASNPHEKALQNARQLALKVSANSCYGFFGVKKGMLPCLPIASLTTSVGRDMIMTTQQQVLKRFPGSTVVYGDTDSVMVKFDVPPTMEGMRQSFELGEQASAAISACFRKPHKLEMEKVFFPYNLLNKKRYASVQYMHPDDKGTLDTKGLENVRRDTTGLLQKSYQDVQKAAMWERSPPAMLAALQTWCKRLERGEVPLQDLVQSKSLSDSYASNNLPHVALAERIRRRIEEEALHQEPPRSGQRIPFVVVHRSHSTKLFEKSEDPDYFQAHPELELDMEYYLLKQLWAPIERFICPFDPQFRQSCKDVVNNTLRTIRHQHQRQRALTSFFLRPSAAATAAAEASAAAAEAGAAAAKDEKAPIAKKQRTLQHLWGGV